MRQRQVAAELQWTRQLSWESEDRLPASPKEELHILKESEARLRASEGTENPVSADQLEAKDDSQATKA